MIQENPKLDCDIQFIYFHFTLIYHVKPNQYHIFILTCHFLSISPFSIEENYIKADVLILMISVTCAFVFFFVALSFFSMQMYSFITHIIYGHVFESTFCSS